MGIFSWFSNKKDGQTSSSDKITAKQVLDTESKRSPSQDTTKSK